MTDVDRSTDDLLIEIQDELMHARFRFDALKLIFKSFEDTRAASACQEVFDLASRSSAVCRSSSTRLPGACWKTRNRPDDLGFSQLPLDRVSELLSCPT